MEKLNNFKTELRALLEKYNATISCNVDGDTHGLTYEMIVDFGSSDKWREHKLTDRSNVDFQDIKVEKINV